MRGALALLLALLLALCAQGGASHAQDASPTALAEEPLARWLAAFDDGDAIAREIARRQLFFARAIDALAAVPPNAPPRRFIAHVELLATLDRARAAALARPRCGDRDPTVRAVAAHALAMVEPWPASEIAALLADPDGHVVESLFAGVAALTQPARRRFVRACSLSLLALLECGDPGLRLAALRLLALDDRATTGAALAAALPRLSSREQRELATAVAESAPPWPAAVTASFVAAAAALAAAASDDDPAPQALAWRLAARFEPEFALSLEDATLTQLLALAGGAPCLAQEHAAAALGALLPALAPRLPACLPALEGTSSHEGAIEIALRTGGGVALDAIVAQLLAPRADARAARPLIESLGRLPCEAIARRLDDEVAPRLAPALRPDLAEVAMRMPPCEARNRVLVFALRDLAGEARLRPFEALARGGDSALLGFLLDALDHEQDGRVRGRMIEQIAESHGGSDPDEVLDLIAAQWRSPRAADRLAALEGVPFVALGERGEAVARAAIERFAASAPQELLHVLAQVGGAVAERHFEQQAATLRADPEQLDAYRFLLSRAGRLGGPRMQALLDAALADPRADVRESALRALLDAGDRRVLEAVPRLLPGLEPMRRGALLGDLGKVRHHEGYARLVQRLLAEASEESDRTALLELAEPALRDVLLPLALERLEQSKDAGERHALLAAIGQLGGAAARATLDAAIAAALARPDALLDEDDPLTSEGRTALLALASADPPAATPALAEFLLRSATARGESRIERDTFGLPPLPAPADPSLIGALVQRPADEVLAALAAAWARRGERVALADERYFSDCADLAARAGAPNAVCEWFESQVLALWPPASAADFRALLPPGARRDWLRRGALAAVDRGLLADLPALAIVLASGNVPAREELAALGRSDLLAGSSSARTLATLAALAELDPADDPAARAAAFAAAAREAAEAPALLRELVIHGRSLQLELPAELVARAAEPRLDDPELAALRRQLAAAHR